MSDTFDKQLEEVLPCNMRCSPGITHSAHCFAARRPAACALIDALIAGAVEPLIPKIKRAAAMLAMLADRDPIGRKTIDDFADELNETRIALESAPDAARLALEERLSASSKPQHHPACNFWNQPIGGPGCICVLTYKKALEERDRRVRWDEARKWFNNNDFGWCQRRLNELDPEHAPAHRTGVQGGASRDDS